MAKKKGAHRRSGGARHQGRTTAPGGARTPASAIEGFVLLAQSLAHGPHRAADAILDLLLQSYPRTELEAAADRVVVDAASAAWEGGWQVADLVHFLGRKRTVGDRRLLVRALSAAAERWRHLASADPEWTAQLESVEADAGVVAVDDPGAVLRPWADAERVHRADAVLRLAELVGILWELPRIAPAGDPPSAWGRRPALSSIPAGEGESRMLGKIRALLAKAESTEFAAEAESLSAKAQELMTRYAIDHALLAATTAGGAAGAEEPHTRRILIHDPYANGKSMLLSQVARTNRCHSIWFSEAGFSTIVGFPTDLALTELLYTSLVAQCSKAMQVASHDIASPRAFRSSFTQAFAIRIGERLDQAADDALEALADERGDDDFLPILASRDEAVERAFDEAFPHRRSTRTRISDPRGWHAGRAAADAASISRGAATLDP